MTTRVINEHGHCTTCGHYCRCKVTCRDGNIHSAAMVTWTCKNCQRGKR